MPPHDSFTYSFDNVAKVIGRFTEVIGLDRFAPYIFDYGAPTGLRLALAHPERITAIITQNGNAYEEGLSEGWNPDPALLARAERRQPPGAARAAHAGLRSVAGNIPMACRIRRGSRRTAARSTAII